MPSGSRSSIPCHQELIEIVAPLPPTSPGLLEAIEKGF